ncbi:glucosaminidase domain-containing protein [Paenibacillus spongiae]|uniref:glucosaminidase domain-containing protein n=1 Tax=Paenibacillus spongiae TaxID=2909671 RepID=UPI0021AC6853|nr:glucosaminidase domain-containing protein [Paenibacillus spongiae]
MRTKFKGQSVGRGNATTFNSKSLGGALQNTGSAFEAAGKKYGVDPILLAAIAMHETGNGTSSAVKGKNNVGGMMRRKGGLMEFGSLDEGIDAMASNLKRLYIDQGLTTIEQIQRKYAPVGAANDPTGLNKNWVNGVTKFYNMLKGVRG